MVNQILFFNCIHVESEDIVVVKNKDWCLDEASGAAAAAGAHCAPLRALRCAPSVQRTDWRGGTD